MPREAEPVIVMATNLDEALDSRGKKTRRWYEGENFIIGCFDPSEKPATEQIELLGRTVSTTPEALEHLSGRTLSLRRVDARYGWMKNTRYVLVADSVAEPTVATLETAGKESVVFP